MGVVAAAGYWGLETAAEHGARDPERPLPARGALAARAGQHARPAPLREGLLPQHRLAREAADYLAKWKDQKKRLDERLDVLDKLVQTDADRETLRRDAQGRGALRAGLPGGRRRDPGGHGQDPPGRERGDRPGQGRDPRASRTPPTSSRTSTPRRWRSSSRSLAENVRRTLPVMVAVMLAALVLTVAGRRRDHAQHHGAARRGGEGGRAGRRGRPRGPHRGRLARRGRPAARRHAGDGGLAQADGGSGRGHRGRRPHGEGEPAVGARRARQRARRHGGPPHPDDDARSAWAPPGLTSASAQVSATSQTLSQGTSEQAASVEETTSSLEQMSRLHHPERREQPADRAARGQGRARTPRRAAAPSRTPWSPCATSPRRSRSSRRSPTRRTSWR